MMARESVRSPLDLERERVATRGTCGRPDVHIAGVSGLAVAGDWVGPVGMIGDAAILSGAAAATAVAGEMMVGMERSATPS